MSIAMRDAFGKKLAELGATFERLVVLDADVSSSTKSAIFANQFPDRFFNCGVSEANMVGVASGLASSGLIPVVNAFAIFLALKSLDQIRNDICYNNLPVIIAGAYGGLSDSFDGASHQSITDIAIMRAMPNMEVIVPSDSRQAELALEYAITRNNPVYIRLNRNPMPELQEPEHFSSRRVITIQKGSDITIASNGITAAMANEAGRLLAKRGVNAEILSVPFVKPLDKEGLVASVRKTGRLISIEEHTVIGGFGGACLEALATAGLSYTYRAIGIQDTFTETGPYEELLEAYGLSVKHIVEATEELMN